MHACETCAVPGSGGRDLSVDVYRPAQHGNRCGVILLHGGGWQVGDRRAMAPYADALASHGFVAIAAEYRLSAEALWPAQLLDVRSVFNWAIDHADVLGVDAGCIAFQGFSAGGHLAMMAAGTALPDHPLMIRPAAVVALFAPSQLHLPPKQAGPNPVRMLLGPDADAADAIEASPVAHLSKDFPPTFLLNGTADPLVSHDDALGLFARLTAAGVPVDLQLVQGQTHEFSALPRMLPAVQAAIAAFLDRVVIDPAGYAEENLRLNMFANPDFMRSLAPAEAAS